jgi:hypothetical protein
VPGGKARSVDKDLFYIDDSAEAKVQSKGFRDRRQRGATTIAEKVHFCV